jgi:hypothetical protein
MKTLITLLACLIFGASGCMVLWTDHAFLYTFAKSVDTKELALVADPNSTKIGSGQTKTKNDKIKGTAIIGGVPVQIESKD